MANSEYRLVSTLEDTVDGSLKKAARRHIRTWVLIFFLLEAFHLLLLLLGYAIWSNRATLRPDDLGQSYRDLHSFTAVNAFDLWGFGPRNENQTLWDSIFPEGEGLVSIPKTNTLAASQLSKQSPLDGDQMIYQVGVFHHLHCLRAIKWAIEGKKVPPLPGGDGNPLGHPLHCVDWILQALLCNVDVSLDATKDFWTFGQNSQHQCRNFNAVLSWTEKHRYRGSLIALRESGPPKLAPWNSNVTSADEGSDRML